MSLRSAVAIFILSWVYPLHASTVSVESLYTDLSPDHCKTIETDEESGSSVQECPGVAGYRLLVEDGDGRQSATLLAPDGKRHPLDFWQVITSGFSVVGDKAEWRVVRRGDQVRPVALIVPVYANENPDAPDEKTSYRAVAKITGEKICVTAKVAGGAGAQEEAKRAADAAAGQPCLE